MASSASSSGTETPATEPYTTPEYGEVQIEIRSALKPRNGLDNLQIPKRPTRLKLILPKVPQEPTAELSKPRRSLRAQQVPQKRDSIPAISEAALPRKRSHGKKQPNNEPSESLNTTTPAPISAVQEFHREAQNPVLIPGRSDLSSKSNSGDVYDPIDVDALPSPPPPPPPHRFLNRYPTYHTPLLLPLRSNVPPPLFTPNGARILAGKVSGHQSHDVYKGYISRRDAPAPPGFTDNCTKLSAEVSEGRAPSMRFLPSGAGSPASASKYGLNGGLVPVRQYTTPLRTQHQGAARGYRSDVHLNTIPVNHHQVHPLLNENHLRQRAVQFVLDQTRPRPRKYRLADDPDETSSSEYEDEDQHPKKENTLNASSADQPTTPTQPVNEVPVSTPSTVISEEDIYDRKFELAEMVEHTQLLTAMLMTYPRSEDQKGLRDDITMLAALTNKRFSKWASAEEKFERGTQERLRLAHTLSPQVAELSNGLSGEEMVRITKIATEAAEAQRKQQDEEIRKYLYAGSNAESEDDRARPKTRDT